MQILLFKINISHVIHVLFLIPVPSANKRDIRSIEQTMADIQAKKRLKKEEEAQKDDE